MNEITELGFNRRIVKKTIDNLIAKGQISSSTLDRHSFQYNVDIESQEFVESDQSYAIMSKIFISYNDDILAVISLLVLHRVNNDNDLKYVKDDIEKYFNMNYKRKIDMWLREEIEEIELFRN